MHTDQVNCESREREKFLHGKQILRRNVRTVIRLNWIDDDTRSRQRGLPATATQRQRSPLCELGTSGYKLVLTTWRRPAVASRRQRVSGNGSCFDDVAGTNKRTYRRCRGCVRKSIGESRARLTNRERENQSCLVPIGQRSGSKLRECRASWQLWVFVITCATWFYRRRRWYSTRDKKTH